LLSSPNVLLLRCPKIRQSLILFSLTGAAA
jgi:hypothetical protein